MAGDYWVRITQEDRELGAGFVLTTCYVLTALHCLNTIAADNDVVNILLAGGQSIPGRVHRRLPEADMALIDVPERGVAQLKVPGIDRAAPGGNWRSPYRPSTAYAQLSGIIDAFPVPYHCEGGDDVQAIQLECTQPLGDYSGYSGSPIERDGPDESEPVLGLLIEQYPDQQAPERASTVLWAVAIQEPFRLFDCLQVRPQLDTLAGRSGETSTDTQISDVDKKLRAFHQWSQDGILDGLDPATIAAMRVSLLQSLVNSGPRGGGRAA